MEVQFDTTAFDQLAGVIHKAAEGWASLQQETMKELGDKGSAHIVTRTHKDGVDKFGVKFVPYSTKRIYYEEGDEFFEKAASVGRISDTGKTVSFAGGYAEFKQGLGASEPNLSVNGKMLGLEGFERPFGVTGSTDRSVTISFTDSHQAEIAQRNIDGGSFDWNGRPTNLPQRDFWGLGETDKEKEQLEQMFHESLHEQGEKNSYTRGFFRMIETGEASE